MKANPGGEIDPKDAIGRKLLIKHLWDCLDQQSIVMVSERRMGKTTIAKCMRAKTPENRLLIYRDVENIATPIEFVQRIAQDAENHISTYKKGLTTLHRVRHYCGGMKVASVITFPPEVVPQWKSLLEKVFEDLIDHQDNTQCIFVWDELPMMIHKINQTSGPSIAAEVLDALRHLRQTHSAVRMIFSGSIGLHHVESLLKQAGHVNDSTGDMKTIKIMPLAQSDAVDLATQLIQGEELACLEHEQTSQHIAEETDCIPFYIHQIISTIRADGSTIDPARVTRAVNNALTNSNDAWHLQHYRDRLTNYYGEDRLPVVLKVLDTIAVADKPVEFKTVFQTIKATLNPDRSSFTAKVVLGDEEALHQLIGLLLKDHYLQRGDNAQGYQFKFNLIKRWWCIHRDLSV